MLIESFYKVYMCKWFFLLMKTACVSSPLFLCCPDELSLSHWVGLSKVRVHMA